MVPLLEVQAQARCCSRRGLTCTYRTAGPSGSGIDDQVEVPCTGGTHPLGESTREREREREGVREREGGERGRGERE